MKPRLLNNEAGFFMTSLRATDTPDKKTGDIAKLRKETVYLAISAAGQSDNLVALLESLSYEVKLFTNEIQLRDEAGYVPPAFLMIQADFEQSQGNGFQVAADFHRTFPETQIIILSESEIDMVTRLRAVRSGAAGILPVSTTASALWAFLHNDQAFLSATAKVLIIDDSPTDGFNTKRLLKKHGMDAEHITSPYDVLQACEQLVPDLLLVDFYMPECKGDELVRALRMDRRFASLPIIYLSSESNQDRQLSAMAEGADDFITKPFQTDFLVRSITHRVRRSRRMRLLSERDSMSGLLNHATCLESLRREMSLSRESGAPLTFAMLDIDHFKQINDTHGHLVGDQVIRSISAFLKRNLRDSDHIGRYGGEEFSIVFPDTDVEAAYTVLNRIRRLFAELPHIDTNGEVFHVTFSAGLVSFDGSEDMTYWADQALYQAKRDGRNTIRTATSRLPTSHSI